MQKKGAAEKRKVTEKTCVRLLEHYDAQVARVLRSCPDGKALPARKKGGFPMLNKEQKEYFRLWLTESLNESLAKARATLADISDPKDRPGDAIDEAAFSFDVSFALRIREREVKLIAKIRDALQRLEDGTFGICEECGKEIPLKRLMARPVTTLCIQCKKEQEAAERFIGDDDRMPVYHWSYK
jgi:DnaK suppressor protein